MFGAAGVEEFGDNHRGEMLDPNLVMRARQEEQEVRKEGQEEGAEEDRDLNRVEVADDKEEVERGLGRPVQVAGVPGGRLRPAWPPVRTLTM